MGSGRPAGAAKGGVGEVWKTGELVSITAQECSTLPLRPGVAPCGSGHLSGANPKMRSVQCQPLAQHAFWPCVKPLQSLCTRTWLQVRRQALIHVKCPHGSRHLVPAIVHRYWVLGLSIAHGNEQESHASPRRVLCPCQHDTKRCLQTPLQPVQGPLGTVVACSRVFRHQRQRVRLQQLLIQLPHLQRE